MKKLLLSVLFVAGLLIISCTDKKQENVNDSEATTNIETNSEGQHDVDVKEEVLNNEVVETVEETKSTAVLNDLQNSNFEKNEIVDANAEKLRKSHENFLANSPFKGSLAMSKSDRKNEGLAPNKYYEQEWELTMDPATGKPNISYLYELRKELANKRANELMNGRTPGDASDNNWIERGPNNVGGRVRALMFDPNDLTYKTVFAGGVSGGLWKNTDITNSSSQWTLVSLPDNLTVSTINYDPNDTDTFYVGTGESYVGGDVNGDGLWKSTDGGNTWTNVFGGVSGPTTFESQAIVSISSPGSIAGDYPCYPTTAFGPALTTVTAEIELVSDVTPLGCNANPITNNLTGKIALIRRGNCPFVEKILNAQNAGAVAVIMMNNIAGTPIPMGGSDLTVSIPSVMISKEDGDVLEAAVLSGAVNGSLINNVGLFTGLLVPGQQHINDVEIKNNGGTSEIYVAAGDGYYGSANALTFLGGPDFGLYKSTNGGTSWTKLSLPLTGNGNATCPNDVEIGVDGKIWVSTTNSFVFGDGGGRVFMSNDGGTSFTLMHTVTGNAGGQRVQIEASKTNANKLYVLSELGQANTASPTIEVKIEVTNDAFGTTPTSLSLPVDNTDSRIGVYGFTGAQAFYNLFIESNPSNDSEVYIGGLNLYKSTNSGVSWTSISQWNGGNGVHSDQHGMAFTPAAGNNSAVFGNDGGVYYCSSLSSASNGSSNIVSRNNGLNITQFYSVGVAPTNAVSGLTNEYFAAGAQDNGTQYFGGVTGGVNPSIRSQGGDGAFTMMDQGADKYYISNYVYNESVTYRLMVSPYTVRNIDNDNNGNNGAFIAPMALDSNQDVLYADYSNASPGIRRYRNLKSGLINRTTLTDALLTAAPSAFAVSPYTTGSTTLLVGTRLGKLLKLTNANTTPSWSEITGPSFVGSVSDVEYGQNENEIFVTMHNYNVVSVWYTNNGGASWQNKEGDFPDIPVKAIMQNPLNLEEVIIGTELGVWYTNNFSAATPNWHQSYNGMSNVKVTDLDLRDDNVVFAATYGRGIFSGQFTADILLAENSFENETGINVYPNPATSEVNLALGNFNGILNVEIYSLTGKKVMAKSFEAINNAKVDISSLQTGVYVLKLKGNNLSYTQKIIKN